MADLRRWTFIALLAAAICTIGEARAVEVLGTGTWALLGNDLTDLGNDGVESLYFPPADFGGFDATFFSSDEPGFGGGEFAFNVFDNILGPGNDKWCCGTIFPQIVGADFREAQGKAFRLTHFTVSSANDSPQRDPVIWRIEGSNDGDCWITIFSPDDLALALENLGRLPGTAIWTDRLQVIRFDEGVDYAAQDTAYSMFRMVTLQTSSTIGAFFQVGEIEFFGDEAEPPVDPPQQCTSCTVPVIDLTCEGGAGQDLEISWTNQCNCADPIAILVNGIEIEAVAPDATSYTIPAASIPREIYVVTVANCSGLVGACTPFKTDPNGSIIGLSWLALGPFATPIGCDGIADLFLTNHIGPGETIGCQFPVAGDPVEGYLPGDPFLPDPSTASTSGYHPSAPTDAFGNPVWRLFSDATPTDGDLNFEQGPAGPLDQQVQFVATWVENTTDAPMDLEACFGHDDDGQVWIDDKLVHNRASCSARSLCQVRFRFTLPPGVHVITAGVWEEGGDWGMLFGLVDPATALPIVDLAGILDLSDVPGASPLSADIVFHGTERPADFTVPECSGVVCPPVTNLSCTKDVDGAIDMAWENPEGCEAEIRIFAGKELAGVVAPGTTSFRIEDDAFRLATMVSVDNGSFSAAHCMLVEVLPGLIGSDLTDYGDDGVELFYSPPNDWGAFDATFFSSDEWGFEGLEAAFNVFDNVLGPGNAKWCCGTSFPQIVGADFRETLGTEFRLTFFTVASANDEPDRDPRVWRIEGSRDGENWTTVFSQDDPGAALWTERLQVLLFQEGREYEVQQEAYSMFRMVTDETGLPGGDPLVAFFQIGEIEFFGEEGVVTPEICDNKIDDDGDLLIDCEDPSCAGNAACAKAKFRRGDTNDDGKVDLSDAIVVLGYLFQGAGAPTCFDAADSDDSGVLDLTDGIYPLTWLFQGGPEPPAPGPKSCGSDTTPQKPGQKVFPPCVSTKCP